MGLYTRQTLVRRDVMKAYPFRHRTVNKTAYQHSVKSYKDDQWPMKIVTAG